MITKQQIVNEIIAGHSTATIACGNGYAPSNIALAKYWGKRDHSLNLPINSSLSISLADKGATASIRLNKQHSLLINGKAPGNNDAIKRLVNYLDLFPKHYALQLELTVPIAAGLASSACIFAATALALNDLHQWQLSSQQLSILARLGSGSAARSIEHGFVEWCKGKEANGMDSYASRLEDQWPELCIGLCIIDQSQKKISSRVGMQRTVETSPLYTAWPQAAENALTQIKHAIATKDFMLLGKTAEHNALTMHATMLSSWPPLLYSTEKTIKVMQDVWDLRQQGVNVYFTQDAGHNVKLLLLEKDCESVTKQYPSIEIIRPFRS